MAELQLALIPTERHQTLADVAQRYWMLSLERAALLHIPDARRSLTEDERLHRLAHIGRQRVALAVMLAVHIPNQQRAIIGHADEQQWEAWQEHGVIHVKAYHAEEEAWPVEITDSQPGDFINL